MSTAEQLQTGSGVSPDVVRGLGLESKFRYWRGASGRRYLFSAISARDLIDLDNVVVLIPRADHDRAGWVGEFRAAAASAQFTALPDRPAFVHLLARSENERRAVIEDLAPLAA